MPPEDPTPAVDRAKQLFRFLKAFAERAIPPRRRWADHHWTQRLHDLPNYPTIVVGQVQLASADDAPNGDVADDDALITIRRPKLTRPPELPDSLVDWLSSGWSDPEKAPQVNETRNFSRRGETVTEEFGDSAERLADLDTWKGDWEAWAAAEIPARRAARVFDRFFELKGRIDRDSERLELVLGDGRLQWTTPSWTADHPILLQRVELAFDPDVPEFRIVDAERDPELYGDILVAGDNAITAQQLNTLRAELQKGAYHPLAATGTGGYLRRVAQTIAANGRFEEQPSDRVPTAVPVISRDPILFLRDRASGFAAAFDKVLIDIEQRGEVPTSLSRLVGVEVALPAETSAADSSPWGEPPDVLLSKPANEEQIRIARALDRHKAVLVQGPPGTGKSHTIANLVGHLVAQGKKVLITSHTTKALRVLRGQIVETLRPLCVALLDNDIEGRTQMEEAVKGILSRLTTSNESTLERELSSLAESRSSLNNQIAEITKDLRTAREGEYLPIVIAGESISPSDAARSVKDERTGNDWIPGTVEQGAPLPLSVAELQELYGTNALLTREEEAEIGQGLPPATGLLSVGAFSALVNALDATEPPELSALWERSASESELPPLERLTAVASQACTDLAGMQPWQKKLVGMGHRGGSNVELWTQLDSLVKEAGDRLDKARPQLLQHAPDLPTGLSSEDAVRVAREMEGHVQNGGSLGSLSMMFHGEWKAFQRAARCNGQSPTSLVEFRALRIRAELDAGRDRLGTRWDRQAKPTGLPEFASFGDEPEPVLSEYTQQFSELLNWWNTRWPEISLAAEQAGFRWTVLREREVARSGPVPAFERDVELLAGVVLDVIDCRLRICRKAVAQRLLRELSSFLEAFQGSRTAALLRAVEARSISDYANAYDALRHLMSKIPTAERRMALLEKLSAAAPNWARAVRDRHPAHDGTVPSGDVNLAWRWKQLNQELVRRASLDERELTSRLHFLRAELRGETGKMIDRRAWLGQIRRIDLKARQALEGWAQIQRRIGKGTGKRVPALQAEARKLLTQARDAVPVWIMPLSRVAESFDPTKGKFDVVIVDEASQSDMTGLLAWYLGDRIAVVGDHEQVSPLAVGQQLDTAAQLISQYLLDIPNHVLYDGKMSIYDMAKASFGGTIALREHFRCVPEIIDFSNYLSYNGDILPLRDPTRVPRPHVVECVVGGIRDDRAKRNLKEARMVVAVMKALLERPEHASSTMGAISLLGDEQAGLIQELALELIGAVELERRRFAAGNAAQFQGDERDVMFLSMVDSSTGGVLRSRTDDAFKQRYNVAASRARDQLWLMHSLDPNRDLGDSDLRRRLIDHVRDPSARRMAIQSAHDRAESPFEKNVLRRLISAGYRAKPQVWVGAYRIDIVVSDNNGQVAVECDGDRFHGVDQIPADMARQAVLERAGWRFVRIRGTRYYRDEEGTAQWLFDELSRLGVQPVALESQDGVDSRLSEFRDDVLRRAWEIMREANWTEAVSAPVEA